MSFNGLVVLGLLLGLLGSAGVAAHPGVPAGDYAVFMVSSLEPDRVQTGKNLFAEDGSFAYSGDDGTQFSGRIDAAHPRMITGQGTITLPKVLGLFPTTYPDGATHAQMTLRGSYRDGVFKGSFSSPYEQGLFHFAAKGVEEADVADDYAKFLLPPDDPPYRLSPVTKPVAIVLPGAFSADEAFAQAVSSQTLANTVEQELKRAGFEVIERSNFGGAVEPMRASYVRGAQDPAVAGLMTIGKMKDVQWIVFVDLQMAAKVNQTEPPDQQPFEAVATKDPVDKVLALLGVVADLADERTVDLWKLQADYRIVERDTARILYQGSVEDIMLTTQTTSKTLGAFTVAPPDVGFERMMRHIVQLAVEQMGDCVVSQ